MKSIRHPFVIYDDFELMLERMDDCDNDPKESVTLSGNKHEPCGFFYLYQIFI